MNPYTSMVGHRKESFLIVICILSMLFIIWLWSALDFSLAHIEIDQFIRLMLILAIAIIFTLYLSSLGALIVQAFTVGMVLYLDLGSAIAKIVLIILIIITAIFLHKMKQRIYGLIEERARKEKQLRKAVDELKKVDELKDEMIFVASHDLRTPVSIIRSNLASIREGYAGKVNKEARTYVDAAYRASERLSLLLEDLLEVSVLEQKDTMRLEEIQVEEVIADIVHEKKTVDVKITYPHPPYKNPKVLADKLMLQRALENLISNAMKFTKKGTINVTVDHDDEYVHCHIHDTGIGISPEAQERIFTKFYRATNAVNAQTRGSGLGLYITKQIIQKLRGKIWFESKMNHGSTFHIELPRGTRMIA